MKLQWILGVTNITSTITGIIHNYHILPYITSSKTYISNNYISNNHILSISLEWLPILLFIHIKLGQVENYMFLATNGNMFGSKDF